MTAAVSARHKEALVSLQSALQMLHWSSFLLLKFFSIALIDEPDLKCARWKLYKVLQSLKFSNNKVTLCKPIITPCLVAKRKNPMGQKIEGHATCLAASTSLHSNWSRQDETFSISSKPVSQ